MPNTIPFLLVGAESSLANSIVGLSQLGNDVGFIGKINNDDLGQKYEDGLQKENVNFLNLDCQPLIVQ